MTLRVRFTLPDDLPHCISISRDAKLHNTEQNRQREELWRKWLEQGSALSVVIVDETESVKAFGLSVAVQEDFAHNLRCESILHPLSHLLMQRQDAVLTAQQMVRKHRTEGLHLLTFHGWRQDLPTHDVHTIYSLLLKSFLRLHHGLHLRSLTKEVYGEEEVSHYIDMGCDIIRETDVFVPSCRQANPYLVGIDREIVQKQPRFATYLYEFFQREAPLVHFWQSQLVLVQLAYLFDLSDEEIAEVLGIQEVVVRQRWCRLYETLDRKGVPWRHSGRNNQRHDFLRFVEHRPEVVFPVLLGSHFYRHPELARHFAILGE